VSGRQMPEGEMSVHRVFKRATSSRPVPGRRRPSRADGRAMACRRTGWPGRCGAGPVTAGRSGVIGVESDRPVAAGGALSDRLDVVVASQTHYRQHARTGTDT